ncbi:A24 family peptidase [Clostridium sp. SYSU_GA19001]|uniref:prepilin peptidase n=1 Tax=Clostridium caldaquaticum TaxID=2940653 RepID=UPI0020778453|nr:A24 family peptidase [Clostridium caldaquaticum]MCM8710245.1 A24 family peptidase [Clostridium caldaquaticum]
MTIIIFLIGLLIGFLLNLASNRIYYHISGEKIKSINFFIVTVSAVLFLILFIKFGLDKLFIKGVVMSAILIVVSFVDLRYEIIPDRLCIIALICGLFFVFSGDISFIKSLSGMLTGGIILFLLALIPGALGGGDIKLMFGIGAFLGTYKVLWAIFIAFALSAVISIFLLLFKVKGAKDYIPFGPFLALGSFLSFLIFT